MMKYFTLFILLGCSAFGATIYSVAGTTEAFWSADQSQILYGSWTQTSGYTNVSITALLGQGSGSASAYLTNQVGNTTTVANVIASTTVAFPGADTTTLLFSSLSLAPGTYFLVIGGTGAGGTWRGGFSPIVTTDAGVTGNPYGFCTVAAKPEVCDAAFGPASVFGPQDLGSHFAVTGDLAGTGVPEPATALLVGASLLLAIAVRQRRRDE